MITLVRCGGTCRVTRSTHKLARRIEAGTARIRSATLSWQRGRGHVALSVELPDPTPVARTGGRVVGVDLGITSLAVLSTGQTVPNPRHLDRALRALRRAQRTCSRRRGPDRRTPQVPSNRWRKAKARVTALQIEYKAPGAGVRVVVADRWYPSSKTCSACGAVKAKLSLAEREFVCDTCGTRLDRDTNAALNLAVLADQAVLGELRPDVKRPAGNPRQPATGGNGYRHGKAAISSQGRLREVATP